MIEVVITEYLLLTLYLVINSSELLGKSFATAGSSKTAAASGHPKKSKSAVCCLNEHQIYFPKML